MKRLLLFIVFSISSSVVIADEDLKPYVPFRQQVVNTATIAGAVAIQVPQSQTAAIPLVNFTSSQASYALNLVKGEFGEHVMDGVFTSRLLQNGGWMQVTPHHSGRTGIDGLYFKMDKNGLPRDLLVSDAKFGSAKLGTTQSGKQMSETWIKNRLHNTTNMYRQLANQIEKKGIERVGGIAKNAVTNRVSVPLNDKLSIDIWQTRNGIKFFCPDKSVTSLDVQRQLQRTVNYFEGTSNGKIAYRSRLLTYRPDGNSHVFIFNNLDQNANVVATEIIRGEYSKLSQEYQRLIKAQVQRTLIEGGKSLNVVRKMTEQICNDPSEFQRICMRQNFDWRAGLDKGALRTTGIATAFVVGVDLISQYVEMGQVDLKRTAVMGTLAGGSALAGNYAGTQASILLSSSLGPLSGATGSLVGGGVASVFFSYGLWAAGYSDLRTAHVNTAAGTIIAATPVVLMGVAYTLGTAGTGVAISSLSGAAATSASLAWLGGGTLAAGGSGVAGGTVVLGVATGGVAVVVVGVTVAITYAWHLGDEANQRRYISGIIDITKRRVKEGTQVEWQ